MMYKLELTEEELNFIYDRCSNKAAHLEDLNLKDVPCYRIAHQVMHKIYESKKVEDSKEKEIKYWIIKNPDTGLYYRGKGVNRWGKYLNQASIFRVRGTVEDSCRQINRYSRDGERAVIVEIKINEVLVEELKND